MAQNSSYTMKIAICLIGTGISSGCFVLLPKYIIWKRPLEYLNVSRHYEGYRNLLCSLQKGEGKNHERKWKFFKTVANVTNFLFPQQIEDGLGRRMRRVGWNQFSLDFFLAHSNWPIGRWMKKWTTNHQNWNVIFPIQNHFVPNGTSILFEQKKFLKTETHLLNLI